MEKSKTELQPFENWLKILINTYRIHPSHGLAKVINYYLERIINHEDTKFDHRKLAQYCSMKKFWLWRSA
ncbi:hypothetical protein Q4493_11340 [Colwellia sp. 1_MG-2023]|uniref:hypothetical protein n=1 Tax=Colwellia sp. 1_MG-2023 TaxID=3062649 RepID=UPI0026E3119A|nr:hypothetical protein [Colwellia sp. 1_MG-2023]MDO6446367.1 hypothetical protein [Colwellia sp. 1_MG-2023]